ncbi:preprotein translocase subunit SecE [Alteribacillus sp. HJP-4]|uniref:preprotein translocase subunit SecE n=1 Tax=Alteribacillus sp. HJP-4 TaxID=2775394 RepID=UPI0035CD028F
MADGTKNPIRFLRDVNKEMKRVTWPTRKELTKYTIVVIITIIFFIIFFALIDSGLSELVRIFLPN